MAKIIKTLSMESTVLNVHYVIDNLLSDYTWS